MQSMLKEVRRRLDRQFEHLSGEAEKSLVAIILEEDAHGHMDVAAESMGDERTAEMITAFAYLEKAQELRGG